MPTNGDKDKSAAKPKKRKEPLWLVYIAALLSGALLLADALGYAPLQRVPARLGIALVFSAFALIVGGSRKSGYAAAGLMWAVTILTFFV